MTEKTTCCTLRATEFTEQMNAAREVHNFLHLNASAAEPARYPSQLCPCEDRISHIATIIRKHFPSAARPSGDGQPASQPVEGQLLDAIESRRGEPVPSTADVASSMRQYPELAQPVEGQQAQGAKELFDRLLDEGFLDQDEVKTWTLAETEDCLRIMGEFVAAHPPAEPRCPKCKTGELLIEHECQNGDYFVACSNHKCAFRLMRGPFLVELAQFFAPPSGEGDKGPVPQESAFDITSPSNRYKACPKCGAAQGMGLSTRSGALSVLCTSCDFRGPSGKTDKETFDAWNNIARGAGEGDKG